MNRFLPELPASLRRPRVLVGLMAVVVAWLVWYYRYSNSAEKRRLEGVQHEALRLLESGDPEATETLWAMVKDLRESGYRDPEFGGAIPFLQGVLSFRDAENLKEGAAHLYRRAESSLREAEQRSLVREHRPTWAHALGLSLYELGEVIEAEPLLEEARRTYEPGGLRLSQALLDVWLQLGQEERLQKGLSTSEELLQRDALSRADRDRLHLLRARFLLGLDRPQDAEEELAALSDDAREKDDALVLRARILMAGGEFPRAIAVLDPIAKALGSRRVTRAASYLLGVCAQEIGNVDVAISDFERTAERFRGSPEGLAADVRAAALLQRVDRTEEALETYRRALSRLEQDEEFHSPWLGIEDVRQRVLDAWKGWQADGRFEEALELARLSSAVFPEVRASEMEAETHEAWARSLEGELETAPFSRWEELRRRARGQWRRSGQAYVQLAENLRTTHRYADVLWKSVTLLKNGHDYEGALASLTAFLEDQPKDLEPLALVRRAEILLHLERFEEALEQAEAVVTNHPTAPVVFEARHLAGRCRLELGELEEAEEVWEEMLTLDELAPDASEWRRALFSLGRMLWFRAAAESARAARARAEGEPKAAETAGERSRADWADAIRRLREYLKRYPESEEATEARYLLARALQHAAELPQRQLPEASTEYAREALRSKVRELLQESVSEHRALQRRLTAAREAERLDDLGRSFLRDSSFALADAYFGLERLDEALLAYGSAVNRFPDDVRVLPAYVRMTDCYRRLDRPSEAEGVLRRAEVVLKQMPEETFEAEDSILSRPEWEHWLNWARPTLAPGMAPAGT